jgi:dsRNA-specific ribonuclease
MTIDLEAVRGAIALPDFPEGELLEIALTHPSYIYENNQLNRQQKDLQELKYRRFALLGDSVFNSVVIDYLDVKYPNFTQGKVTKLKSKLVSRQKAFEFAMQLNLRHFCLLGGSEKNRNPTEQIELLGEMFEALLGAIYLGFNRDFARFRHWLVTYFIAEAVEDLVSKTPVTKESLAEDSLEAVSVMPPDEVVEKLWQMKESADAMVANDEKLQELLTWIEEKCRVVRYSYKQAKLRAFYLAIIRLLGIAIVRNFDPSRGGSKARHFVSSFNRARDFALDLAFNYNPNLNPANVLVTLFALELEPELKRVLQELEAEIPEPKEEKEGFEEWRQARGLDWAKKIEAAIGFDLNFTKSQKDLLKEYYNANKLLEECIDRVAELSPETRDAIEKTMFLPNN